MLIYVTRSLSYSVLGRWCRTDLGGDGSSSPGDSGKSSTMFHLRPSRDSTSVSHTRHSLNCYYIFTAWCTYVQYSTLHAVE